MKLKTYILFLIALLPGANLLAQKSEFVASAPATVPVGQQFQYTIEGNSQGNISLPSMPDFEVLAGPFTSFSSSTQWVNGRMTAKTTASYTYIFRANEPGDHTCNSKGEER